MGRKADANNSLEFALALAGGGHGCFVPGYARFGADTRQRFSDGHHEPGKDRSVMAASEREIRCDAGGAAETRRRGRPERSVSRGLGIAAKLQSARLV